MSLIISLYSSDLDHLVALVHHYLESTSNPIELPFDSFNEIVHRVYPPPLGQTASAQESASEEDADAVFVLGLPDDEDDDEQEKLETSVPPTDDVADEDGPPPLPPPNRDSDVVCVTEVGSDTVADTDDVVVLFDDVDRRFEEAGIFWDDETESITTRQHGDPLSPPLSLSPTEESSSPKTDDAPPVIEDESTTTTTPPPIENDDESSTTTTTTTQRSRLVRGRFTFPQVRSISLLDQLRNPRLPYDLQTDSIIMLHPLSVSTIVLFSCLLWNESFQTVLESEMRTKSRAHGTLGLKLSQSVGDTFDSKKIGTNVAATATTQAVSFLIGGVGGIVTAPIAAGILSSVDVSRYCKGTISKKQLEKNLVVTGAGVAGGVAAGTGGSLIGALIGQAVIPIPVLGAGIGAIVGGVAAGAAGSAITSHVAKNAMSATIEDDSVKMMRLFQQELGILAAEYILSAGEFSEVVHHVRHRNPQTKNLPAFFRSMYKVTAVARRPFVSLASRRAQSLPPRPPKHLRNVRAARKLASAAISKSIVSVLSVRRFEISLNAEDLLLLAEHQDQLFEGLPTFDVETRIEIGKRRIQMRTQKKKTDPTMARTPSLVVSALSEEKPGLIKVTPPPPPPDEPRLGMDEASLLSEDQSEADGEDDDSDMVEVNLIN